MYLSCDKIKYLSYIGRISDKYKDIFNIYRKTDNVVEYIKKNNMSLFPTVSKIIEVKVSRVIKYFIKYGSLSILKYVIANHDVGITNKHMLKMAKYDRYEMFRFIISLGCRPYGDSYSFMLAYDCLEIVRYLTDIGIHFSTPNIAAEHGNLRLVKYMCENNIADGDEMYWACENDHFHIVRYLVSCGEKLKKSNIKMLIYDDNVDRLVDIFSLGIEKYKIKAIKIACSMGYTKILYHPVNVYSPCVMEWLVKFGHLDVIKIWVKDHCDMEHSIMKCVQCNKTYILKYIISVYPNILSYALKLMMLSDKLDMFVEIYNEYNNDIYVAGCISYAELIGGDEFIDYLRN